MIPVMQTNLGPYGDCFRACIASILEVPIEIIPEPTPYHHQSSETFSEYVRLLDRTLARQNMGMIAIQLSPDDTIYGYSIVTHQLKADSEKGHARVAYDGVVVHNPFPEGSLGIEMTTEIMDWAVLYPLDPTKPFGRQVYDATTVESGSGPS